MKYSIALFFAFLSFLFFPLYAQKAILKGKNLDYLALKYARQSFSDFDELLSLQNDAHFPEDIEKNIQWCEKNFPLRGFSTQRLATETVPLLLAERKSPKAKKTILVYLQLDGQPVDPSKWEQESPWKATLKKQDTTAKWQAIPWEELQNEINPEWRIFARAAADAKGPVMMFLAALDAARDLKIEPSYNLKIIMDFEEELGSPQLPKAVEKHKEVLKADALIIFDGPMHISNQPTLSFGARGIATFSLTVFGPKTAQHSGHYGNYVPNPAFRLAQLLASMKDDNGRVLIDGFYEGIEINEEARKILAKIPDNEAEIKQKLGIGDTDKVAENYQLSLQYPSINIRGMSSGWIGNQARTIIPPTATAFLDVRLVLESNAERLLGLIEKHIRSQGYYLTKEEPTDEERSKYPKIAAFNSEISYNAFRTDFDTSVGKWLKRILTKTFNREPIMVRTDGGSIPISPFVITLGIPAVSVPTVNRDNNQHSPNENIRLGNYIDGVKTFLMILAENYE